MEHIHPTTHVVYAMQHIFRPNGPLADELLKFYKEPGYGEPRFLFPLKSTRTQYLEATFVDQTVENQIIKAETEFADNTTQVRVKKVGARAVKEGVLVALLPADPGIDSLIQLPLAVEQHRVRVPEPSTPPYITALLKAQYLTSEDEVRRTWKQFEKAVETHVDDGLYDFSPLKLDGTHTKITVYRAETTADA